MPEANLFGDPTETEPCAKSGRVAKVIAPKLIRAQRHQVMLLPTNLENLLPEDHIARGMWTLVGKLDLSRFLAAIETRENEAGRPAIDPRILVTLWLYATSEGVGSARELARLCTSHDAYRWICGGVSVCPHTLSDFRAGHKAALDDVMTQILDRVQRAIKAKEIYKQRAATTESINADLKCLRGLDRFLVRTLPKVTCVAFWSAIAYNALKLIALV